MEAIAPFIFSLFFIGVVILIIYGFIANQRRKKELRAYAQSKGLQFHAGIHRDFYRRFPEFSCLKQGHSRRGYNIIIGDYQNHPVVMFDYQYKTGSGKHQHTHSFSGVILDANLPLKPLVIRREHFFDKVGEFMGFDDIDFEWEAFSNTFFVKSPDKKWAYDVIHQKTMEYLMSAPDYKIEMQGQNVMAYSHRLFSVYEFDQALAMILSILALLPDSVLTELRGA